MKTYMLSLLLAIFATPPAHAADWMIRRSGAKLMKNGHPWRLVGGNNYRTAGGPPALSCQMAGDAASHDRGLETLFAQLQRDGLNTLRIWAFQSYAGKSGRDYSAFDRVLAAAKRHHVRLIMVLENHWGDCTTGGIKPAVWYQSGYAKPYGSYALSFPDYVQGLVSRYKGNTQIAAWQLMNEAESTDGPGLTAFAKAMARRVKAADPTHLVSVGTLACRQWGTDPANMRAMHASTDVDLVEAHDYGAEPEAMPACIAANIGVARALGKPFFLGEVGVSQGWQEIRGANLKAKMSAHARAGTQGILAWSIYGNGSTDGFEITPGTPTHTALRQGARLFDGPLKDEL